MISAINRIFQRVVPEYKTTKSDLTLSILPLVVGMVIIGMILYCLANSINLFTE